ncbi:E3 ubiquitin-protein ligase TRIM58-like [Molothrus ater]|uniref:E3 ubiquitin-protein ligase TRIM58-like n=1 Tax=Molothrus ater TaxID=84834 RepID=UPI00174E3EE2|nr:E3 ubiquitin-protein ligase TRIM58-like [Molothrus ater]
MRRSRESRRQSRGAARIRPGHGGRSGEGQARRGPRPWEGIPAGIRLREAGEEGSEEGQRDPAGIRLREAGEEGSEEGRRPWRTCPAAQIPPDSAQPELLSLPQLQDLKNELEKRQAKKTPEISQQEPPARGREERNQQPDVKSSIGRCGKVTIQLALDAAPGLEERVCPSWRSSALQETLRKLQASVTLDPDTAHPELVLSEDGKSVWRGPRARPLPDRPERFELWPCVLGRQGFASGRHCWHVDVGDGGDWAVGVARDSVPRKGRLSLGPPGGIWALEKWGGRLRALTARRATPLAPRALPRRVSVHLDCRGGSVAFLDAQRGRLLFAFSRAAFGGERLRPWLWVVGARSQLRLWP